MQTAYVLATQRNYMVNDILDAGDPCGRYRIQIKLPNLLAVFGSKPAWSCLFVLIPAVLIVSKSPIWVTSNPFLPIFLFLFLCVSII